jgi:hypothetical protein
VTGVVEESSASVAAQGVADHTTYRLGVKLSGDAETMYTIFGREGSNMTFPPAFQVADPFGTNVSPSPTLGDHCSLWDPGPIRVFLYHVYCILSWSLRQIGGVNPQFYPMGKKSKFDSWLTVGLTTGDSSSALGSVGESFDGWSETKGLTTSDGGIFWMDPRNGPSMKKPYGASGSEDWWAKQHAAAHIVIAQLTVAKGSSFDAQVNIQGHTKTGGNCESLQCSGNRHKRTMAERDCACCLCRASGWSPVPRRASRQKLAVQRNTGGRCTRLPRKLQALHTEIENFDMDCGECESCCYIRQHGSSRVQAQLAGAVATPSCSNMYVCLVSPPGIDILYMA